MTEIHPLGRAEVRFSERQLLVDGQPVNIGARAFDVLNLLITHRERVVGKTELLEAAWPGVVVEENNLQVQISTLRKFLGAGAITTIPGQGYQFTATLESDRPVAVPHAGSGPAPELSGGNLPATPDRPVRVHRILLGEGPGRPELATGTSTLALPDRPSIAVLPFQNMGGDPEQEYFAEGMVEEIITALSRIRWIFVIARNSSFTYKGHAVDVKRVGQELGVRYVLEGSVRRAGHRVRIAAQLIEATTGAHLWADRFDGSLEDVFDLQNQVAISVAGVIEPTLHAAEIRRSTARPTNDLTAYDLYLRAFSHLQSWQNEDIVLALDLFGEAIKRDPHFGSALAMAARCQFALEANDWTNDPELNRREGVDLARRALGAVADDPVVLGNAAFVLAYFGEDIDAAIELIDRALALNPSFAGGWRDSGFVRLFAGQTEAAINHFETYLRLNPRADRAAPYIGIGMAHFFARRFEDAKAMLLRALQERPTYLATHRFLASCYAHMGRLDEAREAVRHLRTISPVVMPSSVHFRNPEHRELFLSGLRLAAAEAD